MGKRCFNDSWLNNVDSVIWSMYGVSKKMKEQQHANSVKKDINIESMGFAALKWHTEKLKH